MISSIFQTSSVRKHKTKELNKNMIRTRLNPSKPELVIASCITTKYCLFTYISYISQFQLTVHKIFLKFSQVYCDLPSGWTLVARFANNDEKHWIEDANFWFDRIPSYGNWTDPSHNEDMLSEAFWRTSGNEIKITRSDDPTHTALLETTNNCLKGNTFRQYITSFGNFRNGAVWSSDKCLGSCSVKYGGQYQITSGFEKHSCSSDIQSSNYIGFCCDWDGGDGAVMMIGGGGNACRRADHGIGITEENEAKFGGTLNQFLDFGYNAIGAIQSSYALNLWIR